MYIISNFILIAYIFKDLMMHKYVFTHQPNLVWLYALGRRVICMLLANSFPRGRLLAFVWRHILRAIKGSESNIAKSPSWPLDPAPGSPLKFALGSPSDPTSGSPWSRHLGLPQSRYLVLT